MPQERLIDVPSTETGVRTPSPAELESLYRGDYVAGRYAEVLSRKPLKRNGCCTAEEIYVAGHHPMGADVEKPWSGGPESKLIVTTIKPRHIFSAK